MSTAASPMLLVGTSGWLYEHWVGVFYPRRLTGSEYLTYYAQRFPSVEVNYSFYRLPSREVFAGWRRVTPRGFLFAVKASRYLTHMRKLREPVEPLRRLLEAADGLEEKLGPFLFQFPAQWGKNLSRLEEFLELLPSGRRYAFEFRHPAWLDKEVFSALERHGCALCIPDHPELPQALRITARFTYLRFHAGRTSAGYSRAELELWANRIRGFLSSRIAVYAYFNNDVSGYAVENAAAIQAILREG